VERREIGSDGVYAGVAGFEGFVVEDGNLEVV
jgi:hypothetical protein